MVLVARAHQHGAVLPAHREVDRGLDADGGAADDDDVVAAGRAAGLGVGRPVDVRQICARDVRDDRLGADGGDHRVVVFGGEQLGRRLRAEQDARAAAGGEVLHIADVVAQIRLERGGGAVARVAADARRPLVERHVVAALQQPLDRLHAARTAADDGDLFLPRGGGQDPVGVSAEAAPDGVDGAELRRVRAREAEAGGNPYF